MKATIFRLPTQLAKKIYATIVFITFNKLRAILEALSPDISSGGVFFRNLINCSSEDF